MKQHDTESSMNCNSLLAMKKISSVIFIQINVIKNCAGKEVYTKILIYLHHISYGIMHWGFCQPYILNNFTKFNLGLWTCNSFRKNLRMYSVIGTVVVAKVSINSHNLIVHSINHEYASCSLQCIVCKREKCLSVCLNANLTWLKNSKH